MKKKLLTALMLAALAAAAALTAASCGGNVSNLYGTWEGDGYTMTFTPRDMTFTHPGFGTRPYSVKGRTISVSISGIQETFDYKLSFNKKTMTFSRPTGRYGVGVFAMDGNPYTKQ